MAHGGVVEVWGDVRRDDLLATVRDTICVETGVPSDRLDLGTKLADLDIDSIDVLRLAAVFEKRFNIKISTAELTHIRTIGDIVAGLEPRLTG